MFLGGDPALKPAKTPARAQSVADMFSADLADEEDAIKFYTRSAQAAEKAGDLGTRRLFENTALDEEGHKDWLETQLALLERLGEPAYLARQISSDDPAE
jgi:bacterioferritin